MDDFKSLVKKHPIQELNTTTDTRDYLAHSRKDAVNKGYSDWFIVDIDAHHVESVSWPEITSYIDDPVIRHQAQLYHSERVGSPPYGLNGDLGLRYQDVGGRIPHQSSQREKVSNKSVHRDVILTQESHAWTYFRLYGYFPNSNVIFRYASSNGNGSVFV